MPSRNDPGGRRQVPPPVGRHRDLARSAETPRIQAVLTKSAQEMALVDVDRRHRYEAGNGGESRSDRLNATTQPTDGSGQADVGPANQIGSGFQALGRMRHGYALLNRVE
jgi:hypothetical protein